MSWKTEAIELAKTGISWRQIARELGKAKSTVSDFLRSLKGLDVDTNGVVKYKPTEGKSPRILFIDIETAPLFAALWSMFQDGVGLAQIQSDWFILSYCAKWMGEDQVYYRDLRGTVKTEDDYDLVAEIFELLNQADIVVAHNGRRFDVKKVNARLILNGFPKPSPFRVIDTLEIAKEQFSFTSNKLEYLTDKLCEVKKSKHGKFAGYELWKQVLLENPEAWDEMEEYNIKDVLSLEELYTVLSSWSGKLPNFDVYCDEILDMGEWEKNGFAYTQYGKFQVYRHKVTGVQKRSRVNLLSKEKRQSLLANV